MSNKLPSLLAVPLLALLLAACSPGTAEPLPEMQIYKTPQCGCCDIWVDHVREAGFPVAVTDLDDLRPVKERYGIPAWLASCHTTIVDGYIVEGHIPAEDIVRLLQERPADTVALVLPGMPIGSPGMEGPDPEAYDVMRVDSDGELSIWSSHGP